MDNIKEKSLIKNFIDKRRIKYLCHFTSIYNLNSIKRNGIMPIDKLEKLKIKYTKTDFNRFDGKTDCVSISISHFNYRYLTKLTKYTSFKHKFAYLVIDSDVLWKEDDHLFFTVTNASNKYAEFLDNYSGLVKIFDEVLYYEKSEERYKVTYEVDRSDRRYNEPTDDQAELLYSGTIKYNYIKKIIFLKSDYESLDYPPKLDGVKIILVNDINELSKAITYGD